MQEKPERVRKYTIRYLIMGVAIGLVLIGIVSVITLVTLNTPVTLSNLVQLHFLYPLFLFLDVLVLVGGLIIGWVGVEKDRVEEYRRHAESLTQHHQWELNQIQEGMVEQGEKHQAEINQLNTQLEEQGKQFQDLETVNQRGKQQWEGIFDAVDDLIVITDDSGNIQRCNRSTGEVFQLDYNQIIGMEIDSLFKNSSEILQGTISGEIKQIKAPQADTWYELSKNPLLVDGSQEGWVYIFRNISAQKQTLQEQQRLTHYYELLVDNSPVAILTLNQEDRIIDCNPAFESLFHYNKREVLGWKADLLLSPPDLISEASDMTETVRLGEKVHCITQRKRKDGSLLDVEVFGIPVILGGKQFGSLALYHDVTELVRAQNAEFEELEPTPNESAPGMMTMIVDDAYSSEPAFIETPVALSDEVEALPLQVPDTEPGGEEQDGVHQQSEEAVAGSLITKTRKRIIPIEKIEGIGSVYAQKLLEVAVKTTEDLLDLGKSRKGRQILVEKTGISPLLVLKWVNMADLMRIHGIGEEYSELLEKAGVDTVKELRNRNPQNLYEAMIKANVAHKLVRRVPHLSEVEGWIKEAKELEPILSY